jgi:hypothetical protein
MIVNLLVEGYVDEAIARKLIAHSGHTVGAVYGRKGWTYIQQRVQTFDRACKTQGLLTLVDFMDTKLECPPSVVREWLPHRSDGHIFRVVVREIEAWILADRPGLAAFLNVPISKLPLSPELEHDPKQVVINLARVSRTKSVRNALVPATGMSASEGPLYTAEMARFIAQSWDPAEARMNSSSLDQCLFRLAHVE